MPGQKSDTSYKVLLVDDEENILSAITRLLMKMESDPEVIVATSGVRGLEILQENPDVAVILSDQRMPGMTGSEFLRRGRELAPEAARMVLTGYSDMEQTIDAINNGGASRYLLKPWNDEMLRRTILEGVEQYRVLQENRRLTALVQRQVAELSEWNSGLKHRVMDQTATIRVQNEELKRRNQQVSEAFSDSIVAFSRLIELHSSRFQEHAGNVTRLSVAVAGDLKLPADQVETVRRAALLHDIGVIGIDQGILDKRVCAMTREERDLFMQHSVRGQSAVDGVKELREAGKLIRHHHERYGGHGFPDGLAGADIPLGARIITCADWVDREIEESRGEGAVRAVLAKATAELGGQLDPELLTVMEPHIRELYTPARAQQAESAEKELRPGQLLPGMLATRNLYSGAGLLVLSKGTTLDSCKIAAVVRYYNMDPPDCGIHVSWIQKPAVPGSGHGSGVSRNGESELPPGQLVQGMFITRKLYSGTGLLLLTEGTQLDAGKIASVARYYEIDPPNGGIWITEKGAMCPI